MKKFFVTVFMLILILGSLVVVETGIYKLISTRNQRESEELLRIAYNYLNDAGTENQEDKLGTDAKNIQLDELAQSESIEEKSNPHDSNIIGILKIDKLQIEAPIKDGTSQEIMRTSIGHFCESDYWDGNVSLASHNGGTNAHFFEKINTLNINDEINYITKQGVRKYRVQSIKKIESTDWSYVVKNNNQSENTITLITCIDEQPNKRLCVRGVEI